MTTYELKKVEATPYLYRELSCSMDPADISNTMGVAFGAVAKFIEENGIKSMGNPLSVYYTHDDEKMTFRAGFIVSAADAKKANNEVRGDVLPAREVLNFIHCGPYAKLRDSYADMMKYIEANSWVIAAPTVEIYLNSPDEVEPDELETDIYVAVTAA